MYQKKLTRSPRRVDLIICSTLWVPPEHEAHVDRRGRGVLLLPRRVLLVVIEVLQHPLLDPRDGRRRRAVGHDRRLAQDGVADVALDRDEIAEHLLSELRRALLGSGEIRARSRL